MGVKLRATNCCSRPCLTSTIGPQNQANYGQPFRNRIKEGLPTTRPEFILSRFDTAGVDGRLQSAGTDAAEDVSKPKKHKFWPNSVIRHGHAQPEFLAGESILCASGKPVRG